MRMYESIGEIFFPATEKSHSEMMKKKGKERNQ